MRRQDESMKTLRLVINDFLSFIKAEKLVFFTMLVSLTLSFFAMFAVSRLAWAEYREMVYLNESLYSGNTISWLTETDSAKQLDVLSQLTDTAIFPPVTGSLDAFANVNAYADSASFLEIWEKTENKEGEALQSSDFAGNTKGIVMSYEDASLRGYKPGEEISRFNDTFIVRGLWSLHTSLSIRNAIDAKLPLTESSRITYAKPLDREQTDRFKAITEGYIYDRSLVGERLHGYRMEYFSSLGRAALIAVLAFINIISLLIYWLRKNRYRNAVYALCGDRAASSRGRTLFQLLLYLGISFVFGIVFYRLTLPLQNMLIADQVLKPSLPFSQFLIIFGIVSVITLIFILPFLESRAIRRDLA